MQFRLGNYLFCPSWLGVILLMICIPLFIKLGLWQYNKAELRKQIQSSYTASQDSDALVLPNNLSDPDAWKYKKVKVKGQYETKYQILLDNQVENNIAGFHVITPLKLDGTHQYVLINRGWVAGGNHHTETPNIVTPNQMQEIIGSVWVPSKKIFTLESDSEKNRWSTVWQHMDMDRYQKNVPLQVLPLLIKLDPKSNAGGFVRNWQLPASKIATNMGYAYQWFGFTIASILIFLFTSIKKANNTKT
ncbi:SURF1 family protein [Methylotenera sp.]|uniref:SURF1 family protein n=1 Tax=Methylotenera sp. TaxID=2051956 RepID=UPI0025FE614C|nr:SURF1 family protein [Methylotenera sp.]